MDKKVLAAIAEGMVSQVKEKLGIQESEARAFVGVQLRKLANSIVNKIVESNAESVAV